MAIGHLKRRDPYTLKKSQRFSPSVDEAFAHRVVSRRGMRAMETNK